MARAVTTKQERAKEKFAGVLGRRGRNLAEVREHRKNPSRAGRRVRADIKRSGVKTVKYYLRGLKWAWN